MSQPDAIRWRELRNLAIGLTILTLALTSCTSGGSDGNASDELPQGTASADTGQPQSYEGEGASSPEEAVLRMFQGIDNGDQNEFLDVLDPALRDNPENALLFQSFSFSFLGVGVAGSGSDLDFRDLNAQILSEGGDWAIVAVSGRARLAGTEEMLDEAQYTQHISGRWYVSDEARGRLCGRTEPSELAQDVNEDVIADVDSGLGQVVNLLRQGDIAGSMSTFWGPTRDFFWDLDGSLREEDETAAMELCVRVMVLDEAVMNNAWDSAVVPEVETVKQMLGDAAETLGFKRPGR